MKTTVSSRGQIVLPSELRDQDRIEPGQQFQIERIEAGEYRLRRPRGYEDRRATLRNPTFPAVFGGYS